ncbi:histidinol dehydrogenase, partial [Streptococcus hyovaginalis]
MKRLSGTSQDIATLLYQEQVALNAETVSVEETVKKIMARVAREGDAALKAYNLQFDGIELDDLEVSQAQIDAAFEQIEPDTLSA